VALRAFTIGDKGERVHEAGRAANAAGGAAPLDPAELSIPSLMQGVWHESIWPLITHCSVVEHPAGVVLISPTRNERILYLLLGGTLEVYLDEAQVTPVAVIKAGQAVGEISVIEGRPAIAYVVTAESARLLAIDEDSFWNLVNTSHAFAINLITLLAQRMRANNLQLSESVERSRSLEREANTDALTGLLNRRWLDNSLPRFVARHEHAQKPLSVLLIDIDYFKRFNDEHGHAVGDAVLALVAQTTWKCLRPTDLAARYGGEEMVVILPETPLEGARVAAERVRSAIHGSKLPNLDVNISVSIGAATLGVGEAGESLMKRADERLYLAKERGRNRVET
jgi:diguanylate cyclase (GGDEF)-like protein